MKRQRIILHTAEDRPVIINDWQMEKCEASKTWHLISINAVQLHTHTFPSLALP